MVVLEPLHLPDVRSDADLAADAQAGSTAAFAELYQRHHGRILAHCRNRIGGNDAADAAQETFLRAWRGLDGFGGERRFGPWLRTIATNVCIDVLRRRGRSVPVGEVDGVAVDDEPEVGLAVLHAEAMTEALARLSERHRAILQLREYEGWSYERIADHERLDLSAVKSLLWRARQSLRREFLAVNQGRLAAVLGLGPLARLRDLFDGLGTSGGAAVAGAGATAAVAVAAVVLPTMTATPPAPPPPAAVVTTTTVVPRPVALPARAAVQVAAAVATTTTAPPSTTTSTVPPPSTTTTTAVAAAEERRSDQRDRGSDEKAERDESKVEAKVAKQEAKAEAKVAKEEARAEVEATKEAVKAARDEAKDKAKAARDEAKDEAKAAKDEAGDAPDEEPAADDEPGSHGRGGRHGA